MSRRTSVATQSDSVSHESPSRTARHQNGSSTTSLASEDKNSCGGYDVGGGGGGGGTGGTLSPTSHMLPLRVIDPAKVPRGKTASDYIEEGLIGSGSVGKVYEAIDKATGIQVALKKISKKVAAGNIQCKRCVSTERRVLGMKEVQEHPHIVTLYRSFLDSDHLYFVLQRGDGRTNLGQLIRNLVHSCAGGAGVGICNQRATRTWMAQICSAVNTLHQSGVIHGDIKPENILFYRGGVLLSDFNNSALVDQAAVPGTNSAADSQCGGSINYWSPARCRGERITYREDIWALGVLLFECITGSNLFSASSPQLVIANIKNYTTSAATQEFPATVPKSAQDLIRLFLRLGMEHNTQGDERDRVDLDKVVQEHKYFVETPGLSKTELSSSFQGGSQSPKEQDYVRLALHFNVDDAFPPGLDEAIRKLIVDDTPSGESLSSLSSFSYRNHQAILTSLRTPQVV